jgi:hypothetical protein
MEVEGSNIAIFSSAFPAFISRKLKAMKTIRHDTELPGRAFNLGFSECEADMLTTAILIFMSYNFS